MQDQSSKVPSELSLYPLLWPHIPGDEAVASFFRVLGLVAHCLTRSLDGRASPNVAVGATHCDVALPLTRPAALWSEPWHDHHGVKLPVMNLEGFF